MTKQTKIKHYTKRDYAAFAYLAPWIIGMLVLQLYPFLSSLVYSFCNYKITGTPSFTGLSNYIQLFTMDTEFWNSLKVTLAYTLYTVPGKLVMALAVAVFLNRDIKGINLIRTCTTFRPCSAAALLLLCCGRSCSWITALSTPS